MNNNTTYVDILIQSLQKKIEVLNQILELSQEQELILGQENVDLDHFGEVIDKKNSWITQLNLLDAGFEKLFKRVEDELKSRKELYKEQIFTMQGLVKKITDLGVLLQTTEIRTRNQFERYSDKKKKEIKEFKLNNSTVSKYYKNMANQHQGQSYFLDKKK